MGRPKLSDEKDVFVTFRAPASLAQRADDLAKSKFTDRSTIFRQMLARAVQEPAS
jgi:hypothetical protein